MKLQSIQVLRAVAVLAVVFFHFSSLAHGRAGVDLFFVISGFVMAGLMDRPPGQFARERFLRIYPPFLAAIALVFLLYSPQLEPVKLAKTLLLWPIHQEIYLYPAWSLSYEALFYSALVASMFVKGRWLIAAYGVAFALGVPFFGSALILEFLAGFAIARKQWWALPILFLAATTSPRVLLYGPAAVTLVWFCVRQERWFQHRYWKPMALIGDASYAIYLTHVTIGSKLFGNVPLAFVIYGCLAGGFLFHFAIERPLIAAAKRIGRLAPIVTAPTPIAQPYFRGNWRR